MGKKFDNKVANNILRYTIFREGLLALLLHSHLIKPLYDYMEQGLSKVSPPKKGSIPMFLIVKNIAAKSRCPLNLPQMSRSAESSARHDDLLHGHEDVLWFQQQRERRRVKRRSLDYPKPVDPLFK